MQSTSEYRDPKSGPFDESENFSLRYLNGLEITWSVLVLVSGVEMGLS
jgi:hypothetical protein